ncbi:MAG TPA: serine/threonine-protein kinase [Polyangiaceae bacterium]|nr:serine/threonine-protein kinase [Polyangiaceae bacterium]
MSETEQDPLIGTLIADRYRVEKRLGQGGMGAVYLAEHVRMHKPFALKVLHKEMGRLSEAVFRFEREAVAAGRVDHEHLVTATDFGELPDGSMYLVLEYVPGENLTNVMAAGRMPAPRALKIARQIATALGAIHGAGIVHRDVKPDNVMVAPRPDREDFVKLLDFGMAKVHVDAPPEERQVTRQGLVFGTPRYMAPEQAGGEPTDHRADLYSLGVIVYSMLAGDPPFSAEEIRDVLRMQREAPPPPLPADVDPAVAAFVMKLLAKDPAERVQTAEGVVEYIDRLLHRLEAPPPPSLEERAMRFLRTRLGMGVVAAIVVVSFLLAFLAVRAFRKPVIAPVASAAPSASAAPVDPGLEAVLVRAEVGDAAAWKQIEARPDTARGAREWFVLGEARITHGDTARGLDAYLRASELDRKYGSHPRVLRDLMLAVQRDSWEAALRVAAALPGPEGADILFDTWASTPKATVATQRARELLATDAVRAHASPQVRIAFDLRSVQGQSCEVRKPLVDRAVTDADTRSFRPLMLLVSRTGCGPRSRHDCFPCLRVDDALDRALVRARDTLAPDYSRIQAAKP